MEHNGLLLDLINNGKEYMVIGMNFNFKKLKFSIKKAVVKIPAKCKGIPITVIGEGAFQRSYITAVIMPKTLKTIEKEAFCDCTSLTKVVFGSKLTTIGDRAFKGCSSLNEINIPSMVKSIGANAFDDCGVEYTLVGSCKYLGAKGNPYEYLVECNSDGGYVYLKDGCRFICGGAFNSCADCLWHVEIPESVTVISDRAFYGCEKLSVIKIPNSVTDIGSRAFVGTNLIDMTLPNTLKNVAEDAFKWCEKWKKITVVTADTAFLLEFKLGGVLESIIFSSDKSSFNLINKQILKSINCKKYLIVCKDGILSKQFM